MANMAREVQSPDFESEHNEDVDSDHNDDASDCADETAVFLSSLLQDQTAEYTVTAATAMMMADDFMLLSDTADSVTHHRALSTNEVPRLTLDESQGGQIHGRGESNTVNPNQTEPPNGDFTQTETNYFPKDKSNETNLPPKSNETNQDKSNETNLPPKPKETNQDKPNECVPLNDLTIRENKGWFGSQEERGLAERNLFSKQFAHRFGLKSVQNICPENCVSEKTKGVLKRNFDTFNI